MHERIEHLQQQKEFAAQGKLCAPDILILNQIGFGCQFDQRWPLTAMRLVFSSRYALSKKWSLIAALCIVTKFAEQF